MEGFGRFWEVLKDLGKFISDNYVQLAFGSILGSQMEPKMLPNRAREPPKTLLEHASCRTLLPDTFFIEH